jgi:hypothetical protein
MSNAQGDPINQVESGGLTGVARLSRWLNYSFPSNGLTASLSGITASRVPVSPDYNILTGIAYSIEITDPDDPTGANRTNVNYQPSRLLVVSTGYGPRGATKRLEMMVNRLNFEFTPRSTILLRGADDGSAITNFDSGSSNSKNYTGEDNYPSGQEPLPVFGLTNGTDLGTIDTVIAANKPETVADPKSTNLNIGDLNEWLQTADKARTLVTRLRDTANAMERRFTSFPSNNAGTEAEPKFTFVDGDADLGPGLQGTGLLVVTGDLVIHGSTDFYGLILVLGEGSVSQGNGGGNGDILGGIVVARFGATGDFLAPTFNINGGGNSNKQYDSDWIRKAIDIAGRPVLGVVER